MTRTLCTLLVGAVTLALTTACSLESETSMKQHQFAELMQRPDSDQAVARYEDMYAKIRTQLTTTFPQLAWQAGDQAGGAGCGDEFRALDVHNGGPDDAVTKDLITWWAKRRGTPAPASHYQPHTPAARTSGVRRGY
jgi:Lipoprotein confined to pathogenic Mycobacterium